MLNDRYIKKSFHCKTMKGNILAQDMHMLESSFRNTFASLLELYYLRMFGRSQSNSFFLIAPPSLWLILPHKLDLWLPSMTLEKSDKVVGHEFLDNFQQNTDHQLIRSMIQYFEYNFFRFYFFEQSSH